MSIAPKGPAGIVKIDNDELREREAVGEGSRSCRRPCGPIGRHFAGFDHNALDGRLFVETQIGEGRLGC